MAKKIDPFSNGINAAEIVLKDSGKLDGAVARFADTQRELVRGHNEFIDRLAALEARPSGPFPFVASSTSPGD